MSSISVTIDLRQLGRGLSIPLRQIQATVALLDEGNTVPFITRYRKDQTGGLDEEQVREIQRRLSKMRLLAERKQTILRSIEAQGKLTPALAERILAATTPKRLEDLYLPYRPKKQTLATLARSRGLEPLAREILEAAPGCADLDAYAAQFVSPERQVFTAAEALLGAGHILAELISEQAELRQKLRSVIQRTGVIVSTRAPMEESAAATTDAPPATTQSPADKPSEADDTPNAPAASESPAASAEAATTAESSSAEAPEGGQAAALTPPSAAEARKLARQKAKEEARKKREALRKKKEEKRIASFSDYFNYREEVRRIPPHRVLAINRGERAGILRVHVECNMQAMMNVLEESLIPPGHPHAEYLRGCGRDALSRLILPSLERELRRELTDRAETHAVNVFANNLRKLLLQPPLRDQRLLAVDPGFRSGCKLAALDQFGNLLEHGVIFLVGKTAQREQARQTVRELIDKHQLKLVVIGNGTACRLAESFFVELLEGELKDRGLAYVIVNEAGASVYSTSRLGREELPHCDAVLRGAISIGRRLQDPLSELVKIDPANLGVGLYQHDVKAKHLQASLDEVVESCVNYVGVDVNTASPALLRYVSGLNQLTARRLYEYRLQHGPFRNRRQLKEVPGIGEATFVQAAGFLKIPDGDNPLDATWIHPESYPAAEKVLEHLQAAPEQLRDKTATAALAERISRIDIQALAEQLNVGTLTLRDILSQLVRPGRDPREDLPPPVFKHGVVKLEDLTPGMELTGTVLNVVDFGCFVDIGMHQCGLVHISRLADKYVRDPHEFVAVGDIVKVWVTEVDKPRRRISLTMIPPGSEPPSSTRRREKERQPAVNDRSSAAASKGKGSVAGGEAPQRRQPRRKERSKGESTKAGQKGRRAGPSRSRPSTVRKPIIPITEAMKAGKEPMRTFSDLLQFFQQRASVKKSESSAAVSGEAVVAEPSPEQTTKSIASLAPPAQPKTVPPTSPDLSEQTPSENEAISSSGEDTEAKATAAPPSNPPAEA